MTIRTLFLALLAALSWPGYANPLPPIQTADATPATRTIEVIRGRTISASDLSQIADVASARNQKGGSVSLDADEYEIGSFTNTTITVVPPGGGPADVITLDLKPKQLN
ncbi:hypothetical protein Lrub_2394 [Legionella rubrilucens]|uniref:TonB-dependent receptor n=1 Tax=Legionella rubrilucens TaxID=458 RepID=A0A0W0XLP5_9GAMM|nr:hypothetical protein [Legionella rubrilucens]KTD45597.1 hypothetical protein Lrub_2394 [Legionella rubrilucens]